MRLAYLTSQYPAASHTFIRREVEALRLLGWQIDTFSVRTPGTDETKGEADKAEAESTCYILRQSAGAFLGAHLGALFTSPGRYFSTFARALGHRAPGAKGLLLAFAHFAESVLLARELKQRQISASSQPFRQFSRHGGAACHPDARHRLELHDARHFGDRLSGRPDAGPEDRSCRLRGLRLLVRARARHAARRSAALGQNARHSMRPAVRPSPSSRAARG